MLWFGATGHTLRGAFLAYWQQHGGLAQFGYPLTEEFFEPVGPDTDNKPVQVQYFERNRFEQHPENQPPYDVLPGTLGRDFHSQDPPAPAPQQPSPAPALAPALYFPETGHNLGGKFLEYWQAHGGLAVHGYPITEPAMEGSTNGKEYMVQWFERSRMELHPENSASPFSPYEVLLGLLGRQLSEKKGYPFGWYPRYSHAIDFSWVSGDMKMSVPVYVSGPKAGCSVLQYDQQRAVVQVDAGKASYTLYIGLAGRLPEGTMRVVFGQLALPGEHFFTCLAYPNAIGYFLQSAQPNPSP